MTITHTHDGYAQRRQNDLIGLRLINDFRWMRTTELGPLMWQDIDRDTARHKADRVVRSWLEAKAALTARAGIVHAFSMLRKLTPHKFQAPTEAAPE